ncbi:phage holin [Paenibacillus ehimensis]|uniref:phage holin n=1 Tax=Paenibacillus ehimensis TaxID=79264 RepID=UPI002DB70B02|nr:phage holin [Paenibacillus ehimensis]MEC0211835.1 phage holin [Paenibacillus ehimensis]
MDFQPYISDIAQAFVGLLSAVAITAFFWLKKHFINWIDSKTTGQQRETLHKVAEEAFAFVETTMTGQKGAEKLNVAIQYASTHLGEMGIQMDPAAIRAAIEKAVLMHKAATGQAAKAEAPAEQQQTTVLPDHVQQLIAAASAFAMAEGQPAPQQTVQPAPAQYAADPMAPPTLYP